MARPKCNWVILDPGSGKARPGAYVTVYDANTLTKTTLYADDDLTVLSNPIQANGLGQVSVRVNPGVYDVAMTWDGAQPTVVEDVLAWTPVEALMTEPGDIIIGGPDGEAVRLPLGTAGQVLISMDGTAQWRTLSANNGLPDGTTGSLLGYTTGGAVRAILPGLQDQALAIQGGQPEWVSSLLPPGTTLPINQPGDLVVGAVTTGAVARLPRGTTDQVLTVAETGGLVWSVQTSISPGGAYCYIELDGGVLKLLPWKGNQVWINSRPRTIPDGGVAASLTGLSADTTYYIYAAWSGSAITVEASTTSWDETGGLLHKFGDPTRTLVGMARTVTGPAWINTPKQRFVLSFFYPSYTTGSSWFTAPRSMATPDTTFTEINSEIRVEFICWGWEQNIVSLSGSAYVSDPGIITNTQMVLDGGALNLGGILSTSAVANEYINVSSTYVGAFTEGHHYATIHTATNGPVGVATWHGDVSGHNAVRLHTIVIG